MEHFRVDAERLLQKECGTCGLEFMVLEKGVVLHASYEGIKKLQSDSGEINMNNDVVIRKDSIWGYTIILLIKGDEQKFLDAAIKEKLHAIGAKIAETLAQLYSINRGLSRGQTKSGFKHTGEII